MKVKNIVYDPPFEKRYKKYLKKLTPKGKEVLKERLNIFKNNIFDKRLGTHKLKGI